MTIIYNKLDNNFTQIPNTVLLDCKLSALAKNIYFYICYRLGTNSQWEFFNNEIIGHFKEGRDAFKKAKAELIQFGYLQKINQQKREDGTFGSCDYVIYKTPWTENPSTVQPSTVQPMSENQPTNNKEQTNTLKNKQINKKEENNLSIEPDSASQEFFDFYKKFENLVCDDSYERNMNWGSEEKVHEKLFELYNEASDKTSFIKEVLEGVQAYNYHINVDCPTKYIKSALNWLKDKNYNDPTLINKIRKEEKKSIRNLFEEHYEKGWFNIKTKICNAMYDFGYLSVAEMLSLKSTNDWVFTIGDVYEELEIQIECDTNRVSNERQKMLTDLAKKLNNSNDFREHIFSSTSIFSCNKK